MEKSIAPLALKTCVMNIFHNQNHVLCTRMVIDISIKIRYKYHRYKYQGCILTIS